MSLQPIYPPLVSARVEGRTMKMVQFLEASPLFQSLTLPQLESISKDVQTRRFNQGEIILSRSIACGSPK